MDISNEIAEGVYTKVWENVWCECRKIISDHITAYIQCTIYDSQGSLIDDTLRGNIGIEVLVAMRDKNL